MFILESLNISPVLNIPSLKDPFVDRTTDCIVELSVNNWFVPSNVSRDHSEISTEDTVSNSPNSLFAFVVFLRSS